MAAADLLDLEAGQAPVSVALLQVWCDRLGVTARSVLAWAAGVGPPGARGLVLDLRTVATLRGDRWPGLNRKLAVWARKLLDQADSPFLAVPEAEIRILAARWKTPMCRLVELLADLTPLELVPWNMSGKDHTRAGARTEAR